MATDIKFTPEKGITLSESGDYARVEDEHNARQQITLDIIDTLDNIEKTALTPNKQAKYLSDVRDALQNNDAVDRLMSVSLDNDADPDDETVVLIVRTQSAEYGIRLGN